jgi:hypothetical protein
MTVCYIETDYYTAVYFYSLNHLRHLIFMTKLACQCSIAEDNELNKDKCITEGSNRNDFMVQSLHNGSLQYDCGDVT